MTALVTVSETASATARVSSSDAPVAAANAAARRRMSPTADGTAGSSQAALDPVDARTHRTLARAYGGCASAAHVHDGRLPVPEDRERPRHAGDLEHELRVGVRGDDEREPPVRAQPA